jgi:two-component system, NtrC family, response regulator HydG
MTEALRCMTHSSDDLDETLLGTHPAMVSIRAAIRRVAASSIPVLIEGETGTGKELIAAALHRLSGRRGPYVPVNIATLPEQLADAELFGAERGAYTGAHARRVGLVEHASNGTLLLDEAGDLPVWLQSKLLRVFEDGCVRPLGANGERRVTFRLVVATQYPPEALLAEQAWRHDFFFRVAGVRVRLPPLRHRQGDVLALASRFVERSQGKVRDGALEPLATYDWPGNVRQLKRVVERAIALAESPWLSRVHVEEALRDEVALLPVIGKPTVVPLGRRRGDVDAAEIRRVVHDAPNYSEAARSLGFSLRTLHRRLDELGLR